ncbi:uncharacterized protein LOC133713879 isoform X2 [Rosa rugosa]|uniref:uncharacterized protein LOC133713879 isoform X2 n=1 Tax=Rosa rugosa TaxID=74645 RepID=UPI002B4025F5|nr:uncharacterized protein LOC133713879 isoform X2 [Rosa rugosa]
METPPLNVDNMNYDERLYLIKDLINLITDLEMHNITYGYLNYENLLYANGTLKMRVIPDPSHPDFKQMCADRNILTLREGFAIILDRIMPYSRIPNGVQRDYNHFKRLTEFNLPIRNYSCRI